jgi:hypothetical protein
MGPMMADSLNQIVERMRRAGVARQAADLLAGAAEFSRATTPTESSYFIAPLELELATVLLLGESPHRAAAHRASFVRLDDDDSVVHIGAQSESAWRIYEWRMLMSLRLLDRDFRPLPGFRGKPTFISASSRADLRRWTALFVAFAAQDAAASSKAIAVLGRHESKVFSIMAYALYREATRLGMACRVPRKYAF